MNDLKYNKSHVVDKTARDAIEAADEIPVHIADAIKCIKLILKMNDLELAQRVQVRDKKTGKVYR